MLHHRAKYIAVQLLVFHSLFQKGWTFAFDKSKRRFGCCDHTNKKLLLSEHLTTLNDEARVRLTILHEIAHALAGHKAGHNATWKRICLAIGGDGKPCYTEDDTVTKAADYGKRTKGVKTR